MELISIIFLFFSNIRSLVKISIKYKRIVLQNSYDQLHLEVSQRKSITFTFKGVINLHLKMDIKKNSNRKREK